MTTNNNDTMPERVLIVDDDGTAAEALATLVRFWGYEVKTAYDGATATDIARTFRPRAVILDLEMPEMNGFNAAKVLRSESRQWPHPVMLVALTGSAHIDKSHAAKVGFDAYLPKPLHAQDLFGILAQACQAKAAD